MELRKNLIFLFDTNSQAAFPIICGYYYHSEPKNANNLISNNPQSLSVFMNNSSKKLYSRIHYNVFPEFIFSNTRTTRPGSIYFQEWCFKILDICSIGASAACELSSTWLAYHRTCLCLINSNPEYIQTCITTPFWPIKDNCRLLKCESDLEAVIFVGMWDDTCTAAVAKLISEMCQIRTNFDNTNHDSSEKN